MSAKNPGLGTLSILPRELRDEIYRYVFKGYYCFYNRYIESRDWTPGVMSEARTIKPDIALLFVSKATYDEFSRIFWSESMFQFNFKRPNNLDYLSELVLRRMMKIELVYGWEYGQKCQDRAVKMLNSEGTLRDSLTITSDIGLLEHCEMLVGHLSKELEAFKSFRKVTLNVNLDKYASPGSNGENKQKLMTFVIKEE